MHIIQPSTSSSQNSRVIKDIKSMDKTSLYKISLEIPKERKNNAVIDI